MTIQSNGYKIHTVYMSIYDFFFPPYKLENNGLLLKKEAYLSLQKLNTNKNINCLLFTNLNTRTSYE